MNLNEIKVYNFRYSSWFRWLWFSILIFFLLLLQYAFIIGNIYFIVTIIFLSFFGAYKFYKVIKYRVILDLENHQIRIANNTISMKIQGIAFYRKFGFDKMIIELEDGVITISSVIEDFELLKELIQREQEANQFVQ